MRRSRFTSACSALALVGAMLLVAPAAAESSALAGSSPAATDVAQRAGISAGSGILWQSDADQARDLDLIASTGAKWLRFDIDWNHIQHQSPNAWNWHHATDRLVLNARARGLSLVAMVAYSPPWARPADCPPGSLHCLPANPADYARFIRAAVERYGANSSNLWLRGSVSVWEIWNEPNHRPFAQPKPSLDAYSALLKAAYPAVKAADPGATVITGGTSPAPDAADGSDVHPITWLNGIYARGAGGSFDAVGHHPYSFPTNPLDAQWWNAFTQTQSLYDVMVANGDAAKKIWGTEAGAPIGTDPSALDEIRQAQWVRDYYAGWNSSYLPFTGPLFWFQHRDSGTNPADREQNFGMLRQDWSPKQAYQAFVNTMQSGSVPGTGGPDPGVVAAATGRRTAANPNGGYYVVDGRGSVRAYGGAPYFGAPRFGWDITRGIAVMPDGLGYVVLDGFGGLHKFGSARTGVVGSLGGPYFGWDIARDVAINPNGNGYVVLDGFGGAHRAGDVPAFQPGYWRGWDIARAVAFTPTGAGIHVLDGFGGVHVAGDAVQRHAGYWRGWDIARDLDVTASGDGYAVLDGFGGVHVAGDATAVWMNPAYAPRDHVRGMAIVGDGYSIVG
ncbi:MAG: hypothetical protein FJW88_01180 [Actinobacteria bacterium]|nr:hypothetical protein [Actinomycetota bacterium]